ncbi:MAG: hypothetical protein M3R63_23825 [Actinomycetota bacterium]|nr:hypothetical protein [Actinomycetota bacterium]
MTGAVCPGAHAGANQLHDVCAGMSRSERAVGAGQRCLPDISNLVTVMSALTSSPDSVYRQT